jgi:hypothetical protein
MLPTVPLYKARSSAGRDPYSTHPDAAGTSRTETYTRNRQVPRSPRRSQCGLRRRAPTIERPTSGTLSAVFPRQPCESAVGVGRLEISWPAFSSKMPGFRFLCLTA